MSSIFAETCAGCGTEVTSRGVHANFHGALQHLENRVNELQQQNSDLAAQVSSLGSDLRALAARLDRR